MSEIYLYRMTHIGNIPHIIESGITHARSEKRSEEYKPIGDTTLIDSRKDRLLENGSRLGDYIPFYFAKRTPMLYVIQKGYNSVPKLHPSQIVYCVSSITEIQNVTLDFVFCDGHAYNGLTEIFTAESIGEIKNLVDWNAVAERNWTKDTDIKRRKEAEFLVLGDIPFSCILGYIVYDSNAKDMLVGYGVDATKVKIDKESYF